MVQGSNVGARQQCCCSTPTHARTLCKLPFSRDGLFPRVPAMGWFTVMAQLSIQKLHHTTRCTADSLPASQPVSLITWGFHTLPDHNAYLPCTSPQLRCLQLEMTITCSIIVGCVFFQPLDDTLLVGRVEGRKEGCVKAHEVREAVTVFFFLCAKPFFNEIFSLYLILSLVYHRYGHII